MPRFQDKVKYVFNVKAKLHGGDIVDTMVVMKPDELRNHDSMAGAVQQALIEKLGKDFDTDTIEEILVG